MKYRHALLAASCAALLVACGGGGGGGDTAPAAPPAFQRGVLLQAPLATASFSAAEFKGRLENGSTRDKALLLLSGDPVCDLDVRHIRYTTLGGAGEETNASGALMVPRGADSRCSGPRPMVLYAHATDPARTYDLAKLSDTGNAAYNESLSLAALFAARGYIVVAPNYAGYDTSPLPYHPFLNAQQQSGEMMDALAAAKSALQGLAPPAAANAKLFLAGYSQGGHVAMATQRAMQQAGIAVTASSPMSGPYALAQELDDNFAGQVHIGATLFGTMIATSYQKSYGSVYTRPEDLYEADWASGIESLLPGEDAATLGRTGKLPQFALFSATSPQAPPGSGLQPLIDAMTPATGTSMDAIFARGFGAGNLFTNGVRLAYLQDMLAHPDNPAHALRIDARLNDLRGWTPRAPMLMCGGAQDATVSFATNTLAMQRLWAGLPPGLVTVLDVDAQPDGPADPFLAEKLGFGAVKGATEAAAKLQGEDPVWEVARNYHAAAFPFCASAASRFFSLF